MLNIIVHKPKDLTRWDDRLILTCESILVRTGPYDNSDALEIKQLETGEYVVLHHNGTADDPKCVLSVMGEVV